MAERQVYDCYQFVRRNLQLSQTCDTCGLLLNGSSWPIYENHERTVLLGQWVDRNALIAPRVNDKGSSPKYHQNLVLKRSFQLQ
jgi:hypothetical protein